MKLFVQGLPDGCDKASLKALFAKYGEVAECDIVKNKFAFVYMVDDSQAYAAMEALDNYEFMGRKLYVRESTSFLKRRPGMGPDECYRCGQKGHRHKDCTDSNEAEIYLIDPTDPTKVKKVTRPPRVQSHPFGASSSRKVSRRLQNDGVRLHLPKNDPWKGIPFGREGLKIKLHGATGETNSDRFALTLWRCPCTMKQSDFDRGRFAPDSNCNTYTKKCDPLHKGAQHCVRTGRPSVGGSGQTCCYDMEGELMLTADTMYGGRPSRIFSYGILPFNSRMKVPTLSYWNIDAMPFFYCCHWQQAKDDSRSCQQFKYWRTSQDCTAYQPPGYAAVFGDPHFLTFDRANYTFTARGEFVLVRVNDPKGKLEIQGRFESVRRTQLSDRIVNGTFLSAVAVKDNVSSTVEIHLRPLAARFNYQLYLVVDNEFIYFWDDTMRIQHFKGVTIYQPTGYYNMSKIVCMFDSGAGVEVLVNNEQLSLNVFLPVEFFNITRGLLGYWDRRMENDLMPPHGNAFVPITATLEQIYHQFGNLWRLNESNALFNHDLMGYKFGHYDDQSFLPYLEDPPRIPQNFTFRAQDVADTCSGSKACIYDFIVTGDKRYAATTKSNEAAVQAAAREVRETVIRCPAIDKPANGRKSEIRNFVGRTVRFTCNDGYRLVGHEVRQCKEYGLWSWGVDVTCISNASYARKIAGVTLGILLPIAIIFCIVFFCFFKRNRHKKTHYTGSNGDFSKFQERKGKTYHGPTPEKLSETTT